MKELTVLPVYDVQLIAFKFVVIIEKVVSIDDVLKKLVDGDGLSESDCGHSYSNASYRPVY